MAASTVFTFLQGMDRAMEEIQESIGRLPNDAKGDGAVTCLQVLEDASMRLERVEMSLSAGALYLPAYEMRKCGEEIAKVKTLLDRRKRELFPRKRFRFRNRDRVKSTACRSRDNLPQDDFAERDGVPFTELQTAMEIVGRKNEDIVLTNVDGKDVLLRDLHGCYVLICGIPKALTASKIDKCHLMSHPISGSFHLSFCQESSISVAARQIRVHDSRYCDLYVHVASGSVIENSKNIRVAPYNILQSKQAGFLELMEQAKLDPHRNDWDQIHDFNWLRVQHSPNWSILPAEERRPAPWKDNL